MLAAHELKRGGKRGIFNKAATRSSRSRTAPIRNVMRFVPTQPNRMRFTGLGNKAFSLVEVVMAIGVVSFALLAVVGTVPVGLETVRESMVQAATANIARQLRGELQQISFNTSGSASYNISNLPQKSYYYTQDGMVLPGTDGAYYKASLAVDEVSVTGTAGDSATFAPDNVRGITVTLAYPQAASVANQKTAVFSLLLAKQKAN